MAHVPRPRKAAPAPAPELVQYYTPEELGRERHLSANTIRRMFAGLPGVTMITRPERVHKRRYTSMRISRAVANRVFAKLDGGK